MDETTKEDRMAGQLHDTHQTMLAADNAQVRDAIGSVSWERRGLLQRLARTARSTLKGDGPERKRGT
jgi:hypothetical protein